MMGEAAVAVINHLLAQSGWAQPRLAPYHGRVLRFSLFPFSFLCAIQPDGSLRAAAPDAAESASFTILPSLLPLLAVHDESALERIEHTGDDALVGEVLFVARHLRWDAAEDLSRFTGDIAAERMLRLAGGVQRHVHETALNFLQALTEYWTEERPLIAKPASIQDFERQAAALEDRLERLERRVGKLSGAPDSSP
jgi:ubiquinone biosynthesis accessory factor UbiJ